MTANKAKEFLLIHFEYLKNSWKPHPDYNVLEAIKFAMRIAWKNDIIILAGKGHETYQMLKNNKKIHFDEREVVKSLAESMPDKNLE